MRPILFATLLSCCSLPVFANQCNVQINGNLQLEDKILAIKLDKHSRLTIDSNKTLYIDGNALPLNRLQQSWVDNYYDGINQAAPQAAAIATDAVALASDALNQVFGELLGSDSHALADLSDKLRHLDKEIQYNFYADNGDIRIHSDSFENGEFFGEKFEEQFENAIETLVTESIGHLMVALGSQLIFSGGDMDEFEEKMQRFGQQIEQKVEYQAEALEEKAQTLCTVLAKVDYAESQLQQIEQLESLDIIQLHDQTNRM